MSLEAILDRLGERRTQLRIVAAGIEASMLFWLSNVILSLRIAAYTRSDQPSELLMVLHTLADDCSFLAFLLGAVFLLTCVGIFLDFILGTEEGWAKTLASLSDLFAQISFGVMLFLGGLVYLSQPNPYVLSRTLCLVRDTPRIGVFSLLNIGQAYFGGSALTVVFSLMFAMKQSRSARRPNSPRGKLEQWQS